MNGYDYVISILENAIKSDENLYYSDYIVHIRKKYEYETEWEESNEYVDFVCDHWEWQRDWYEHQEDIEVLGFDMVDNLNITNRFPVRSDKDVLGKIKAEILYEAEYAYADFDEYKNNVLHAEPDELPDDDFRYGLERAVEIINKYKADKEINADDTD